MVDIRLDVAEDLGLPSDCFVSVRIGDAQKLSRLSPSRNYHFPQAADRRYGKIEVFRRIGSCGVDVDPSNQGLRQVHIGCGETGSLRLNVAVEADSAAKVKQLEKEKLGGNGPETNGKFKAAKDYLAKHGIELILSEAMQAVLRARPDDPAKFLAERLLTSQPAGGVVLPPLNCAREAPPSDANGMMGARRVLGGDEPLSPMSPLSPNLRQQKLEPLHGAKPAVHAAPAVREVPRPAIVLPFKKYYSEHFSGLARSSLTSLYAKFPGPKHLAAGAHPPGAKATAFTSFAVKPSVGTWLTRRPKEVQSAPKSPAVMQVPAVSPSAWRQKPSVGTWLQKRSALKTPVPLAPSAPSPPAARSTAMATTAQAPVAGGNLPALHKAVEPLHLVVLNAPAIYGSVALDMGLAYLVL